MLSRFRNNLQKPSMSQEFSSSRIDSLKTSTLMAYACRRALVVEMSNYALWSLQRISSHCMQSTERTSTALRCMSPQGSHGTWRRGRVKADLL